MNYDEAINYLESLNTFGIKPGLERITRMLDALGNPQSKYKTIHVTGTNGKGSVCAMLSEILSTAGIKVGLFTSPHLNSYRERFKINNGNINEKNFVACIDKIVDIIDNIAISVGDHPTQFEVLTAMAFEYFADEGVEYAVIEVGLGGTLDSTNVINPVVTAITNVGMDHADKCGGTLEGIAHHKAGIIKHGVPVVTAARGGPLSIIKETAARTDRDVVVAHCGGGVATGVAHRVFAIHGQTKPFRHNKHDVNRPFCREEHPCRKRHLRLGTGNEGKQGGAH